MLHTVNKSPFEKNSLQTCLRLSKPGSSILLIEDGVYGALKGSEAATQVTEHMQDRQVYVLGPDLKARGLDQENLLEGIEVVGYDGFVKLAADAPKVQSWM
ncbi:MAG: sulfurtransferase complex subunit TusB [bacterium]